VDTVEGGKVYVQASALLAVHNELQASGRVATVVIRQPEPEEKSEVGGGGSPSRGQGGGSSRGRGSGRGSGSGPFNVPHFLRQNRGNRGSGRGSGMGPMQSWREYVGSNRPRLSSSS
jgi:hypothetical protein